MIIPLIDYGIDYMPERAHPTDAGADVFAPKSCALGPNEMVQYTLSYGVEVPADFAAYIEPKGSTGRLGLIPISNPIDAGYRGPIHVVIWNVSKEPYYIRKGMKIAQLVVRPIVVPTFTVKKLEDVPDSSRGAGAFGSSGMHHE